jgi:hypothetical protein
MVNFAGDADVTGHFIDVEITAALSHSLRGEIVWGKHKASSPAKRDCHQKN